MAHFRSPHTREAGKSLLGKVVAHATDYRASLPDRHVAQLVDDATLRSRLGGPLPEWPSAPEMVVDDLVAAAADGLVASSGPRYFGFVIGGTTPASLAADWLAAAWDQNAGGYVVSPAAAVVEEVASEWLLELLGLPAESSVGFTTGATVSNAIVAAPEPHHRA